MAGLTPVAASLSYDDTKWDCSLNGNDLSCTWIGGPVAKNLSATELAGLADHVGANPGDCVFFAAGPVKTSRALLGVGPGAFSNAFVPALITARSIAPISASSRFQKPSSATSPRSRRRPTKTS